MFDIQKIVDEAVTKNSTKKSASREIGRFNVSDAGLCHRMRFYKRLNIPSDKQNTAAELRKMMAGTASHEKVQYLLKRTGKIILAEDEFGTEHRVGHPDGVIVDGEMAIIDFKTIEKWQMSWIKKTGAKKNHEVQLFTYWSDIRKIMPTLNHAIIFYMKREDWEGKPFNYVWSNKIQEIVDNDWNPLIKYWEKGELPPCTCHLDYDGSGTKYCKYLEYWDDEEKKGKCCSDELFGLNQKQNGSPRVLTN